MDFLDIIHSQEDNLKIKNKEHRFLRTRKKID